MEPELFGPYRLDELIGRGGMGEVYRALDTRRDRVVALKRLPVALDSNAEFLARFRREAALAARLQARHIVPIHDHGDIDGRLFIDMHLVTGTDLAKLLTDQGPLAPSRAVGIIAQVASALDDAHAHGLAHRDVKPPNVLLTHDDFAYLADFGIARALAGGTSLTITGATVGTLAYMAPERFQGQPGDHLADIYALACMLYESLTGHPPFGGEGLPALMYAHVHVTPPPLSRQQLGIPAALDEVIARGMAKDPQHRYTTAGQLATAAEAAVGTPIVTVTNNRPAHHSTVAWAQSLPKAALDTVNADTFQKETQREADGQARREAEDSRWVPAVASTPPLRWGKKRDAIATSDQLEREVGADQYTQTGTAGRGRLITISATLIVVALIIGITSVLLSNNSTSQSGASNVASPVSDPVAWVGVFCGGLGEVTAGAAALGSSPSTPQGQKDGLLAFSDSAQWAFTNTARKLEELGPPRITDGKRIQDTVVGFFTAAAGTVGDQRAKLAALDANDPDFVQKASQLAGPDLGAASAQMAEVTNNQELAPAFRAAPECQRLASDVGPR